MAKDISASLNLKAASFQKVLRELQCCVPRLNAFQKKRQHKIGSGNSSEMSDEFDPPLALQTLAEHRVDFLVIGGFAAWIHGAPIVTTDVKIVYEASRKNVERLVAALLALGAVYRHQLGRRIEPDTAKLSSNQAAGHHLFSTQAGNLDALRTLAGLAYEGLHHDVELFDIKDLKIPIAKLERVVMLKEAAGRPKDLMTLPTLRAVLEERKAKR